MSSGDLFHDALFDSTRDVIDVSLSEEPQHGVSDLVFSLFVGGKTFQLHGELGSNPEREFDNAIPIWIPDLPEDLSQAVLVALTRKYGDNVDQDRVLDAVLGALNNALLPGGNIVSALGRILNGRGSVSELAHLAQWSEKSPYICVWDTRE